jgi:hypothetical protein
MSKHETFTLVGHNPYTSHESRYRQDIIEPLPKNRPVVDAIGVSQGRPAPAIERSALLANEGQTTLLSMASHGAKAVEVAEFLDGMNEKAPPEWWVGDIEPGYELPGVELTAQEEISPQARKDEGFDLPVKRDGLHLVEKMVGSRSLLLSDDDLLITYRAMTAVAGVARGRRRGGLRSGGKVDRSVNQHIKRDTLEYQLPGLWLYSDRGIGSAQTSENSSVIDPQEEDEHSPRRIYNEDTIKAYPSVEAGLAGLTRDAHYIQDDYDPYSPDRAAKEVFGDIYAGGLYDNERDADALYSAKYWQAQIEMYQHEYEWLFDNLGARRNREYLGYIASGDGIKYSLDPMPEAEQQKKGNALMGGLAVIETLVGENFTNYHNAHERDRKMYSKMMSELPKYKTRKEAFGYLGLKYFTSVK